MTKASTAKTVAANKFDVLFNASVNVGKSFDVLRAAFVAAGGDQDEPKRILMAGRVSHALKCTREVALLALSKKGNPGLKTDVPDDVRNIKEQRACGAARTFLSSCLKAWGIKSAEARGGDRSASKGAMDTEKLKPAGKPKVSNHVELGTYALAYATAGYDLFLINKNHDAVKSAHGSELMGAFADFVDSIKEINAKFIK